MFENELIKHDLTERVVTFLNTANAENPSQTAVKMTTIGPQGSSL
jgi:hypothetical protein